MFVKELMPTPRCLVRKPPQKGLTHKVISQLQRGDDESNGGDDVRVGYSIGSFIVPESRPLTA